MKAPSIKFDNSKKRINNTKLMKFLSRRSKILLILVWRQFNYVAPLRVVFPKLLSHLLLARQLIWHQLMWRGIKRRFKRVWKLMKQLASGTGLMDITEKKHFKWQKLSNSYIIFTKSNKKFKNWSDIIRS